MTSDDNRTTRTWTRRQRLVARTAGLSAVLAVAVLAVVLLRPAPEQYIPGEKIEGLTETLARGVPPDHPRVQFVDVTQAAGIDFRHFHGSRSMELPEDMGSGAAWGDYDRDGFLDLYVVNQAGPLGSSARELAASPAHNALYANRGDGSFGEVAAVAGVDYRGCGQAAAWGDYDGDGYLDLCVTNYGHNLLYHNEANGQFSDVAPAAGLGGTSGFWSGVSWGDYDRDGDLDLYVCGYVQYHRDPSLVKRQSRQYNIVLPASLNPATFRAERNLLYRNEGDGSFAEVAPQAGVDNPAGRSLSASWSDLDQDGWIDLYVANDLSDNALYRNLGEGRFHDVSHAAHVADYRGAMGLALGDWDADGDQDLFVTHWIAQENAFYSNMSADYASAGLPPESTSLRFMDVADRFGLGHVALDYVGWGAAFMDYDTDGRLDLFVVNGSTFQRDDDPTQLVPMRDQLFWNKGNEEGFFEVGSVSGAVFAEARVGRGLAVADYDDDGDMDAFVVVHGGRARLLRNEGGNRNNWLKVRLRGGESNPDGLGARLRAVVDGQTSLREPGSSSSYCSQHAAGEELFGLGQADLVDTLEVVWPSGRSQRLIALAANQSVTVREPPAQ